MNPINKNDNSFRYTVIFALNHEKFGKHLEKITKIKPFIDKNNQKGINYPSKNADSKKIEKNKLTISLVLYAKNEKYILPTFENITESVKNKLLL